MQLHIMHSSLYVYALDCVCVLGWGGEGGKLDILPAVDVCFIFHVSVIVCLNTLMNASFIVIY